MGLEVRQAGQGGGFVPADVPQSEADALIALYNATNGPSWTNHTNWLIDTTVGNWFGITVAGGHVIQCMLSLNNLAGSIPAGNWIGLLPSLLLLQLQRNGALTGDIGGWVLPALNQLQIYSTSVSGDISSWVIPASLLYLRLYTTSISGTPDISANTLMRQYSYQGCGLSQANVDAILLSVYDRRMAFTYATPALTIDSTNAAPGGIYQAQCPPTTGKEYKYELINDSCGDGFNKWAVTTS